eukprot:1321766-Amorphochlora_amoeboformis.AAC.2
MSEMEGALDRMVAQYEDYDLLQTIREKVQSKLEALDKHSKLRRWEEKRVRELQAKEAAERAAEAALKAEDVSVLAEEALRRCDALLIDMNRPRKRSDEIDGQLANEQKRYLNVVNHMAKRWDTLAKHRAERKLRAFEKATDALRRANQLKKEAEEAKVGDNK